MKEKGMMTRLTHAGENAIAKKAAASVSVPKVIPIYMSSVFSFDDVDSLDAVWRDCPKSQSQQRLRHYEIWYN